MPHRNDPTVFYAPYHPDCGVRPVEEAATFGRNASRLFYQRQRAQVQQVVQAQARERARTTAHALRQKETTPMPKTIEQLQAEVATLQAETARLRADHAHFQRYGEYLR